MPDAPTHPLAHIGPAEIRAAAVEAAEDWLEKPHSVRAAEIVGEYLERIVELGLIRPAEEAEKAMREGWVRGLTESDGDSLMWSLEDDLMTGPVSADAGYPDGYDGDDDDVRDELKLTKDEILTEACNLAFVEPPKPASES